MRDRIAPTLGWICVTLLSALVTLSITAAPVACAAAAAPAAAGRSMPAADVRSAAPSAALPPAAASLDTGAAARFAALALKCLHQEYPNHISHTLNGDSDVRPPRELTPAFYGCFDWHSDVHGHWLLVRLVRLFPGAPFVPEARAAVARSLTPQNIAAELAYLRGGRTSTVST
ncbi:MAG TPA: DUF2891 family protein [Steroidobacteraceae bacterium]|jgi:hypothetical protein|nr:DUF2891 family protein [Steroidobacteraceae bacterium]